MTTVDDKPTKTRWYVLFMVSLMYLVTYMSWVAPFVVAAALFIIGAGIWAFWPDPEVSVVEKRKVVVNHN